MTVIAVDLGGFAALAETLDPEDLRALADRCLERVADEIRRFDGTVLRTTGDSILAVFGAPAAHEDDAERALRAGLAIRRCALPLPEHVVKRGQIQVRVGIDTGEVLAGLRGPEGQQQYAISGAPVSVAVGLAAGSATSAVLVGEQTYRATLRQARYRVATPVMARDWSRPLAGWEVLGIEAAPRPRALGHAPFVGRDDEMDVLVGTLARVVREERPHLVSVLGEPGIGKSRLIAEFERRAPELTAVTVLHGRCLPYGEALGYRALAMALYELAGILPDDAASVARARLRHLVRATLHAVGDRS